MIKLLSMDISELKRTNLKRIMAERNWKPADLKDVLKCSDSYVSQILSGHRGIGKQPMARLEMAGITVDDLLKKNVKQDIDREIWELLFLVFKSKNADPVEVLLRDKIEELLDLGRRLSGAVNESLQRGGDERVNRAVGSAFQEKKHCK